VIPKINDSESGFLRISSIIGPNGLLPISKSTWWAGVKSGRYPQPVKLGPKITAWTKRDIFTLIANLEKTQIERSKPSADSTHQGRAIKDNASGE
jgi:prophage regulatory protein